MRFRPVVLLEVLISMALAGILLTVLMGYFTQVVVAGRLVAETREEILAQRYAQTRLSQVFHKSLLPIGKGKRPVFFTKEANTPLLQGTSLVFSYDNGAVINPLFSNVVLGRLYVDPQQRLCLATWPLKRPKDPEELLPMQKEVLMEGVSDLRFSFYQPLSAQVAGEDIVDEEDRSDWPQDLKAVPVLLTLEVIQHGKMLTFTLPLPNSHKHPKLR